MNIEKFKKIDTGKETNIASFYESELEFYNFVLPEANIAVVPNPNERI